MIDFSRRSDEPELMDDPSIGGPELERTLDELTIVNALLGGYGPSLSGIERLLPSGVTQFSLLDVGTGAADTPRRVRRWASARGLSARITGIDIAETTVEYARRKCTGLDNIDVQLQDLHAIEGEGRYDVVHAAIVLHHFTGDEAPRAVRKMFELSRYGVIINDLHRHAIAWGGFKVLSRVFSRNRLIRHDGPLSVLRAFSRQDLLHIARDAGVPEPTIDWCPMFRWRVVFRK